MARQSTRNRDWSDLERKHAQIVNAQINIGDITVSTDPPVETANAWVHKEETNVINVPVNAIEVKIYNAGGMAPAPGTVNGEPWGVGRRESFKEDEIAGKHYKNNAFVIVCNGSMFHVSYRI